MMKVKRSGMTLVSLLAVAAMTASCTSVTASSRGRSPSYTVAVPHGWKTYTYGKMAIAVPSTWAVKHDNGCPNTPDPGTLLLGPPAGGSFCADFQYPRSIVTVSQPTSETNTTGTSAQPMTVNGVQVYVAGRTVAEWTVPSLDVHIAGTGPDARRAMHTLHKS